MLQKTRSVVNLDLKHSRIKVYGSEAIRNMIMFQNTEPNISSCFRYYGKEKIFQIVKVESDVKVLNIFIL